MKRKFIDSFLGVLFLLGLISPVFAQNYTERKEFRNANSHWFIRAGDGVGDRMYDMRSFPPTETILPGSGMWIGEGGSGISDTATGDLLFYSSGENIYNRNHQVMPNGAGVAPGSASTMQQLCFVPVIDTPDKYHVFILMPNENALGLFYCKVDMNLDNGLGDVEPGSIFHLYDGSLHEGMVAVPGNNCDVWVLVHPWHDSIFMTYHITSEGLDTVPVVSSPGTSAIYDGQFTFEYGGLAISPQRDKIAISSFSVGQCAVNNFGDTAWGGVMLAKFDAETGMVSEGLKVEHYIVSHSMSFSPNGEALYLTGQLLDSFTSGTADMALLQYDVREHEQVKIMNSRLELSLLPNQWTGLRRFGDTIILTDFTYVPFPNNLGVTCGYSDTLNYFAGLIDQNAINWGNDAVYPLPATHVTYIKDTMVCDGVTLELEATKGYHSYRWNTGEEDSVLTITGSGVYWVEYQKFCHTGVDTFHIVLEDFSAPIITVNEKDLSTSESYDTYQWMLDGAKIPGATSRVHTVKENGNYQVIGSRGNCIDTSDIYVVNNATDLTELKGKAAVRIYPNPASTVIHIESINPVEIVVIGVEGKTHKHIKNAKQISISDLADGLYLIEIRNAKGRLLQIEKLIKSAIH